MIDSSEKRNRKLAFELQNAHVCGKRSSRWEGAIHSTKIPTGLTGKSGPPQKVDPFLFETFPVGPNRSIEFWTEISGNFGWMDRALRYTPKFPKSLSTLKQENLVVDLVSNSAMSSQQFSYRTRVRNLKFSLYEYGLKKFVSTLQKHKYAPKKIKTLASLEI